MITEQTLLPIFTDLNPITKTVSIAIDTVVLRDGVEIARERLRRAFVPGDIENVKEFTGVESSPELDYLDAIWTIEVIEAFNASLLEGE